MPKHPEEPLKKVTFNMFTKDVEAFVAVYGWGWSETARNVLRQHIQSLKPKPKTVADLIGDEDA